VGTYASRYAQLYDLLYADKPYRQEADFVHTCLQRYCLGKSHQLLELACGTGTHALELEKWGYDILATDFSEEMLARARCKTIKASSKVNFQRQDMRSLNLGDETFDAAICLFDSIGYVITNEALVQVLQGVYHHLRPGGLFVFEFWHAGAMLHRYDPVRIRRWMVPEGEILRISETTLECAKQLAHVEYTVYELRRDGTYSGFRESHVNRYFLVQEMAGWLSTCGFTPIKWFAGFREDEKITEDTWHIVSIARRS
jgi:SAM-dependent methyltransferase